MDILKIKEIISEVNKMKKLQNGWDGDESIAPSHKRINSTIKILENWPAELGFPTIEPDIYGNIIMEIIDNKSNEMISVNIIGQNIVLFSVIRDFDIIYQQKFEINYLSNQFQIFKYGSKNIYPRM